MSHHVNEFNEEFMKNFDFTKKDTPSINSKQFGNLSEHLSQANKSMGATGNFPQGKIINEDQGEIALGIATYQGKIIMNFGEKPISWIGFTEVEARQIAESLISRANELSGK